MELYFELLKKPVFTMDDVNEYYGKIESARSAIDALTFAKIKRDLFPVLRKKDHFDLEERKNQAKEYIRELMVLTPSEAEYMEAFEKKEYKPELLFDDKTILENIKEHPMALWKMEQ